LSKDNESSAKDNIDKQPENRSGNKRVTIKSPFERELIVIAKDDFALRSTKTTFRSAKGKDISELTNLISTERIIMRPLFGISEDRIKMKISSTDQEKGLPPIDLSLYYRVEASNDRFDELAEKFRQLDFVEAVYVKPPSEPAVYSLNNAIPKIDEPPNHTPDFTLRQGYLDPAPGGIDARFAWTQPGGTGNNVGIVDIEGEWRFTHEDLIQNQGGVVGGTVPMDLGWRNHGTAVIGEISGDHNTLGITGICPDANIRAISIFGGMGSANAIRTAADMLHPGDIILIELHRAGPRFNFEPRRDQRGYIAIEWWDDDFAAIRYAVNRGIIVVEAAGNGNENLDDPLYNTRPTDFSTRWTNPFNRANRDSGAIMVGAGAPPPNTHGQNHGPDRSRLDFSNFGTSIDAQGWGVEVTSTGYGDLQGGSNEDEWYTDIFSGTSSASPIVVGAIASIQGILRINDRDPLLPARIREFLRTSGSLQQDVTERPSTQRIGNRPDLRQLIPMALNATRGWNHLSQIRGHQLGADFDCSQSSYGSRLAISGDFDGDRQTEIAVWINAPNTGLNAFWVMKYNVSLRTWVHFSPLPVHNADLHCSDLRNDSKFAFAGDFDGDGRMEVGVYKDVLVPLPLPYRHQFFIKKYMAAPRVWVHFSAETSSPNSADLTIRDGPAVQHEIRFIVTGDFDGDRQTEIACCIKAADSAGNDFWVMKYNKTTKKWGHLTPISNHPLKADMDCSGTPFPAKFAVAGDFDRDGQIELAICIDAQGSNGNKFWVMKFDVDSGRWRHINSNPTPEEHNADLKCSVINFAAKFAVAGDFDGDGQSEIAVCIDSAGTLGNDFWVRKFNLSTRRWEHLGLPNIYTEANMDCSGIDYAAKFAVAGDFDGDGQSEIAVCIDSAGTLGNDFWVMKYNKTTKTWGHLFPAHDSQVSINCSHLPNKVKFAVAGDFNGDGLAEIAASIDDVKSGGNDFWVMRNSTRFLA
jgi:hypothetical protein